MGKPTLVLTTSSGDNNSEITKTHRAQDLHYLFAFDTQTKYNCCVNIHCFIKVRNDSCNKDIQLWRELLALMNLKILSYTATKNADSCETHTT